MIASNRPIKLPNFKTTIPEDSAYTSIAAGTRERIHQLITNVTIPTQITASITLTGLTHSSQFLTSTNAQKLLRLKDDMPVMGNLRSMGQLCGLHDYYCDVLATFPRGSAINNNTYGNILVFEPTNYFGKPSTLVKPPRVCLVKMPVCSVSVDLSNFITNIKERQATIDALNVQIVIQFLMTVHPIFGPFSYGVPRLGYTDPGPKVKFEGFEAGSMLTIFFTGNEFGPLYNDILGMSIVNIEGLGVPAIVYVDSPYFVCGHNIKTSRRWQNFGLEFVRFDLPAYHNVVSGADADVDSLFWKSYDAQYARRGFVMHNTVFTNYSPIHYLHAIDSVAADEEFPTPTSPVLYTYGPKPYGEALSGEAYFNAHAQDGQIYGRDVEHDASLISDISNYSTSYLDDIADAIFEDIETFYGA